jgi:hypothetical protein
MAKENIMPDANEFVIVQLADGRLRLDRVNRENSSQVAYAKPVFDRDGSAIGWKLQPIVVVQGSQSKVWPHPADALGSTKLFSAAVARRLIGEADPGNRGRSAQ